MRDTGLMIFHVVSLLGFDINVALVLWGDMGNNPFVCFLKNLCRIYVISSFDGWKKLPAKPSGPLWASFTFSRCCLYFVLMLRVVKFTDTEIRMVVARG